MRVRSVAKLVAVNALILCAMVMGLFLVLMIAGDGYNLVKATFPKENSRADLPVYEDRDHAVQVFRDQKGSIKNYVPFVEWRHTAKTSATLNIDENGHRMHGIGLDNAPGATSLGLFGASTVWGTGVDDDGTIAAQFDAITDAYTVTDYSERGYTTMQNLIDLVVAINSGTPPETVVFYGGASDIVVNCDAGSASWPNSHNEEARIRSALERTAEENYVVNNIAWPMIALMTRFLGGSGKLEGACAGDPERAAKVARALVKNLEIMQRIVAGYGGRFVAFYQPTAFSGKAQLGHLDTEDPEMADLGRQFAAVDPIVRSLVAEAGYDWFVDLGDAIDGEEPLLIDYAHLGPKGNAVIAKRIAEALR